MISWSPPKEDLQATQEAVDLSARLIRCQSVTPQDDGALGLVAEAAAAAGFAVERFENLNIESHKVHNLFARRGTQGPLLAFAGHTDVVPPGPLKDWRHPPFAAVQEDGQLWGRGAADMKSAIAAFITAARLFGQESARHKERQASGDKPAFGSLALLITGDEEVGSEAGMRSLLKWCQAHGQIPDACLIGEASNLGFLGQGMRLGRRGSLNVYLEARGVQGHVAYADPHSQANAVHTLIDCLHAFRHHDWGTGSGPFPATGLQITQQRTANQATNIVPSEATAHLNVRFGPPHSGISLIETFKRLSAPWQKVLTLDCQISGEPYHMAKEHPLAQAVAQASQEVCGQAPEGNAGGGVSDGRFIHTLCPVVEFGLVADTIHAVNEHSATHDIGRLVEIYRRTLAACLAAG